MNLLSNLRLPSCPLLELPALRKDRDNSILATLPEVEKPTNNGIPAKSFTSVNLWNTDRRAADNSQGSLKQGYSAKDY